MSQKIYIGQEFAGAAAQEQDWSVIQKEIHASYQETVRYGSTSGFYEVEVVNAAGLSLVSLFKGAENPLKTPAPYDASRVNTLVEQMCQKLNICPAN